MKNKNVKVIDGLNIDRDANIMFAFELDGSEYVVYWISRDENSNNIFVSKVLKNIDNTYSMLNIDDEGKKKEVAEIAKVLISNSVSDQNDKLVGTEVNLSNGKVAKMVSVSFNKEQYYDVEKTYIATVKKEVTKVAENYYDVVVEESKVAPVLPAAAPVVEPVTVSVVETPVVPAPVASAVEIPVMPELEAPVVVPTTPVVETPVTPVVPAVEVASVNPSVVVATPTPVVVEPITVAQPAVAVTPVVEPVVAPVVETPVVSAPQPAVVPTPAVEPVPVAPTPIVVPQDVPPVVTPATPVVETPAAPVVETNQPLVFNASKETNLNAALGEVASSAAIPVENIAPVREFGEEAPTVAPVSQPTVAPIVQPEVVSAPKTLTKKAGFANSKFFMVVAVAFFLASCIFLGYEVFNYFQLIK